ncbi:MAG: MarR family transcriptional regulator [Scrofimicrobium sp.]
MTSKDALSPDEQRLWTAFGTLVELLPARLDRMMSEDSGMGMFEFYVLDELERSENATLRVSALASSAEAALPRMSKLVARLEAEGKVDRWTCPSDGRATNVTLTDSGREALEAARPGHVVALRDLLLDPLDDSQRKDLESIAKVLLERLNPTKEETQRFCNGTHELTE